MSNKEYEIFNDVCLDNFRIIFATCKDKNINFTIQTKHVNNFYGNRSHWILSGNHYQMSICHLCRIPHLFLKYTPDKEDLSVVYILIFVYNIFKVSAKFTTLRADCF